MKCEWMLQEARESGFKLGLELGFKLGYELGFKQGIEQYKEGTIVSSLQAKLPIQRIAKIARTKEEKVKETAKKYNLENFIVNN